MSDVMPNTINPNEGYERQKALVLKLLLELSHEKNFLGQSMANKATILQWELNRNILLGSYGDREGYLPAGSEPMAIMSQEEIYEFILEQAADENPVNYNPEEIVNDAIKELSHEYPWFSTESILNAYADLKDDVAFATTIPSIKAQLVLDEMRSKVTEDEVELLDVVRYQMRDVILAVMDLHLAADNSQEI